MQTKNNELFLVGDTARPIEGTYDKRSIEWQVARCEQLGRTQSLEYFVTQGKGMTPRDGTWQSFSHKKWNDQ